MTTPDSRVIIVGAGVFGLSTALWLARSGYKNVTIFDRQPYDKSFYNPADGCDSASADINKIFRATYGTKAQYVSSLPFPLLYPMSDKQSLSKSSSTPLGINSAAVHKTSPSRHATSGCSGTRRFAKVILLLCRPDSPRRMSCLPSAVYIILQTGMR